MSYQSQGLQVYHYLSRKTPPTSIEGRVPLYHQSPFASIKPIQIIDSYANPPYVSIKNFGQSRVEAVYESHHTQQQRNANHTQQRRNAHQLNLNQDTQDQVLGIQNHIQSSSSIPISRASKSNQNVERTNVAEDRFQKYLDSDNSFKYNIFSAFDQPWNNCLQGQKCVSLPSNECIASSTPK